MAAWSRARIAVWATMLLAFGALSPATQAGASTGVAPVTRTAKVSLADLDLTTPEGKSAARERLHHVARRLCSRVVDNFDLSHRSNFLACVDEALTAAENSVFTAARP
jgi:UrcA family protein